MAQNAPAIRPAESPEALYAQREDMEKARRAALLWSGLANGGANYDASWKFLKAAYYLGTLGPDNKRDAVLDSAIEIGREAVRLQPTKPEGHFWYGAVLGAKCERGGMLVKLKYGTDVRDEFQKAMTAQPGWQSGSSETGLGLWYSKAGFPYGDRAKALEYFKLALLHGPNVPNNLYALAEFYADDRKTWPDARALLDRVIAAPIDPEWVPEDKALKAKAQALRKRIG